MIKERRRGRASRPIVAASVTTRVRRLVDDVHGGSLLAASAHAGVPYALLRDAHLGRARRASAPVLERLAVAHDLPLDWFDRPLDGDDGTIPSAEWVGFLPSESEACAGSAGGQPIAVPGAAWPLIRVLSQLEKRLSEIPPSPGRPIIGTATDPRVCRGRITAFIFQPIAVANAANPVGRGELGGPTHSQWVEMLRALGRFWEHALGDLM